MNLQTLMDTVIKSDREDWHKITCWGAGSGPSYHDRFTFWEQRNETEGVLQSESHSNVGVYMPDVSITLAFGLDHFDDFKEEWANKFPDPRASSSYVDVFYNNALVFRDICVTVDGGRCHLPLPKRKFDDIKKKVVALEVARPRCDFIALINSLEGASWSDYEQYFKDAGFTLVDEPWPKL